MSSNLKTILFWAVGLKSGLNIYSKPRSQQIGSYPGFVVPFTEHRVDLA